jgi:hypothetical protein
MRADRDFAHQLALHGGFQMRGQFVLQGDFVAGVVGGEALVIGQDLAARGYNDISLYDDSRENLEAFKVVHKAFPAIVYRPKFIDPTWRARIAEFLATGKSRKPLTSGRASALILLEHHSRYAENPEAGLRALQERGAVTLEGGVRLTCAEGKYALERRD